MQRTRLADGDYAEPFADDDAAGWLQTNRAERDAAEIFHRLKALPLSETYNVETLSN